MSIHVVKHTANGNEMMKSENHNNVARLSTALSDMMRVRRNRETAARQAEAVEYTA